MSFKVEVREVLDASNLDESDVGETFRVTTGNRNIDFTVQRTGVGPILVLVNATVDGLLPKVANSVKDYELIGNVVAVGSLLVVRPVGAMLNTGNQRIGTVTAVAHLVLKPMTH